MAFRGWPSEALAFFEGLEADNSKAYWQDHKGDYEHFVLRPMTELLADLEPEFGEGRIFRPYRDVRFSRDKSPYKTNIAATLSEGGYISFSADGLGAGSGLLHDGERSARPLPARHRRRSHGQGAREARQSARESQDRSQRGTTR